MFVSMRIAAEFLSKGFLQFQIIISDELLFSSFLGSSTNPTLMCKWDWWIFRRQTNVEMMRRCLAYTVGGSVSWALYKSGAAAVTLEEFASSTRCRSVVEKIFRPQDVFHPKCQLSSWWMAMMHHRWWCILIVFFIQNVTSVLNRWSLYIADDNANLGEVYMKCQARLIFVLSISIHCSGCFWSQMSPCLPQLMMMVIYNGRVMRSVVIYVGRNSRAATFNEEGKFNFMARQDIYSKSHQSFKYIDFHTRDMAWFDHIDYRKRKAYSSSTSSSSIPSPNPKSFSKSSWSYSKESSLS